jgi:hypothetical protein
VHPLSTYLVFQALTAMVALAYTGVLSVDGIGWATWAGYWAVLGAVGLVWTQLAWGPCWTAGADYGLSAGVRIVFMTSAGAALLLPFLILNVVFDTVWFFYAVFLAPYGVIVGLLGGSILAIRDRKTMAALRADHDQAPRLLES